MFYYINKCYNKNKKGDFMAINPLNLAHRIYSSPPESEVISDAETNLAASETTEAESKKGDESLPKPVSLEVNVWGRKNLNRCH